MVVRMSCWALETCLTYVPRQRRRCAAGKKLTTINLPGSSLELAVGVHLVTHLPSSARPRFKKRSSPRPQA